MTDILLIEDNEDNWISMSILLESGGFKVSVAKTGESGVEKAISDLPDLILLDVQLPDIDGFQVLERLNGNTVTMNIPVIAVTSSAMAGDRVKLLAAGCVAYIEKPINPMKIVDQIKAAL